MQLPPLPVRTRRYTFFQRIRSWFCPVWVFVDQATAEDYMSVVRCRFIGGKLFIENMKTLPKVDQKQFNLGLPEPTDPLDLPASVRRSISEQLISLRKDGVVLRENNLVPPGDGPVTSPFTDDKNPDIERNPDGTAL